MLPKTLKFQSKIESAYARSMRSNIAPQNGTGPYNLGDQIILNISTRNNLVLVPSESYLKFKIFEQLCNQVTDETYNQIERKKDYYNQEQFEKQVLAEIETKKETAYQKKAASMRTMHRNDKFNIS